MKDSIFYSGIRSLFVAFCAIIGIGLGFFLLMMIIGGISSTATEKKLKTVNTQEVMPNAEGKRESFAKDKPVILQLNVDGIIGTDSLNASTVKQQLIESQEGDFKDNLIKGVLVYINTPGGTVTDADGIYRALKQYKEKYKVPIYSYVDGLCASGGMYVASATDKILASDVSLIGSVGVIAPTFMNFTKLLEKVGVDALTISAGKDKDAMNPLRPWKPGEDKNYKDIIDYYYGQFVHIVASNRPNIDKEKLIGVYGAQVFPAKQAQENGYIDVADASLSEALKELVKASKIEGDYQVIKLEKKGWWNLLFSDDSASSLSKMPFFSGKMNHQIMLTPELDPALHNKFLYMYTPN